MQMKPIGLPLSSMNIGGHLPGHDFNGDELNMMLHDREPSLKPSHIGSYEIRPIGMQKLMPIVPKEDDVEKLLMSGSEKTNSRDEAKANFKQFQKSRTKAKNPNNRS
jgi:hypothetical protein